LLTLQFSSSSAVWQWTNLLTSWPECWVSTLHCFFVTYSFIFHVLYCYIISFIKGGILLLTVKALLLACFPIVQASRVQFLVGFLLFTMSVVAFEDLFFFLSLSLHLFILFLHSHLRRRRAQLVSQCEQLKIHQYFTTVKCYTSKCDKACMVCCQN
jgi:hypothetical protein